MSSNSIPASEGLETDFSQTTPTNFVDPSNSQKPTCSLLPEVPVKCDWCISRVRNISSGISSSDDDNSESGAQEDLSTLKEISEKTCKCQKNREAGEYSALPTQGFCDFVVSNEEDIKIRQLTRYKPIPIGQKHLSFFVASYSTLVDKCSFNWMNTS